MMILEPRPAGIKVPGGLVDGVGISAGIEAIIFTRRAARFFFYQIGTIMRLAWDISIFNTLKFTHS
jgi:hypothetical protein